ncbi:Molybdenum transport system permease protein ModB [Pontiella desulfatans]|uniref:Molybdenum transport system permease n=1 Tax=Pontiella desulfatans TaxID=2750659 RepID=A0A6C2U7V5_PONDE|nr:molybdate ABC transporter permease subunit [Pontiella desulfatans]VGO16025.1 Molybdenum transport system permease protein ModB [Pontiella desulfatans]
MIALSPTEVSAIWLSLKVAMGVALATTVPAVLLGWLMARREFRGKILVESLIHAPLVIPPVVTGYLLLIVFGRHGAIGKWLAEVFDIRLVFTWQGAVLASAIVALPLAVRSVRLAVSLVDRRLEEAALTLGYSPFRTFMKVTLPLAWPGILGGILLAFSRSLGEFGATITFAGNVEGSTQTLPLAIYSALQVPGEENVAMRLVVASLVLCFASLLLSEVLTRRAKYKLGVRRDS